MTNEVGQNLAENAAWQERVAGLGLTVHFAPPKPSPETVELLLQDRPVDDQHRLWLSRIRPQIVE
jgi:hypothetical protein